jgi:NodT family efflux transporter outer membrane factor (OMF) lipoprotein
MDRAGFDAAWDVDICGGTRRAHEAARARFEAQTANLQDVWISLAADVALTYIEIRTFQRRLQVARNNLQAQTETLELLSSRYSAGLTDALDVSQARYNMESTRSAIPRLQAGLESALNALAVLVGRQPGSLHACFDQMQPIPAPPEGDIPGIDANALRRRPDIRRAERTLAAESARIGEAVALLYPRFSLGGFFGTQALSSADLFSAGAGAHSLVPGVVWPVFRAGELRNRVRAQSAVKEQYLALYEKTVLQAIAEVRDALSGYVQERRRVEFLQNAVAAAGDAVDIARDRYSNGLSDFNNVLDAQRSLLSLEENLAISQGNTSGYMVTIYKTLGGGWAPFTDAVALQ